MTPAEQSWHEICKKVNNEVTEAQKKKISTYVSDKCLSLKSNIKKFYFNYQNLNLPSALITVIQVPIKIRRASLLKKR